MTDTHMTADLDLVRSLTVIPPWSLAIVRALKPTENRVTNLAGRWRGRVLILSSVGKWDANAADFTAGVTQLRPPARPECHPGHYIGAADLVDVHRGDGGCCGPW